MTMGISDFWGEGMYPPIISGKNHDSAQCHFVTEPEVVQTTWLQVFQASADPKISDVGGRGGCELASSSGACLLRHNSSRVCNYLSVSWDE